MNELENLKCGEEMKDELMNVNSSYLALQAFTGDCNKREWKEFGYRCRKEVASPVLLYLASVSYTHLVLFSNDKNLCTKALANGVLTVSYKKHMTSELIANVVHTENVSRFGKIEKRIVEVAPAIQSMSYSNSNLQSNPQYLPSQSLSQSDSQSHLLSHSRKNSHVLVEQNVRQFSSFHQIAEKVYTEIQMIALSAIHQCMESVFNEDLDLLQDYEKEKVITLTDCSNVMIRFWFTVFQPYFKKLPNKFTPFDESGRNKTPLYVDLPRDSYELLQFVHFWTKTLSTIYAAEMDDSKNEALDILVQRWESMASLY